MAQIHEDLHREHGVRRSSERSFGVVMASAFAVVALGPLFRGHSIRIWALAVFGAFLASALVVPVVLRPLNWAWYHLGLLLNAIVSPIVLGLLYYTIFTPLGLFLKLVGKDVLNARPDPRTATYWLVRRPPGPSPATLRNQF